MNPLSVEAQELPAEQLTVGLIVPQETRRQKLRTALQDHNVQIRTEIASYPEPPELIRQVSGCEVLIIDLATDPERAVDLIEAVCSADPSLTVMAYSLRADPEVLMNCMRAGAREFIIEPLQSNTLTDAFTRAAARKSDSPTRRKPRGRILAFSGSKGGSGVTTIASNFAVCLAEESRARVVLVDMDLRMGDSALILGISSRFSIVDALANAERLDREFLSTLLTKHGSGLSVLAGPEDYTPVSPVEGGAIRLFRILKEEFDYVVVDAGTNTGKLHDSLLDAADTVYLVTEVSIPALRAANRIIAWLAGRDRQQTVEVIINRHDSRTIELDEARIAKALGHAANWNVPNHFQSVREAQNSGIPLASAGSGPIAKILTRMARAACGKPPLPEVRKRFSLFGRS
jgi:pilus assembly protein CpaE